MNDTLYLQLDQNIEVTTPHVYLQDIAALSMSDPKILNRLRVMPVIVWMRKARTLCDVCIRSLKRSGSWNLH